jgi:hypothetical protein
MSCPDISECGVGDWKIVSAKVKQYRQGIAASTLAIRVVFYDPRVRFEQQTHAKPTLPHNQLNTNAGGGLSCVVENTTRYPSR